MVRADERTELQIVLDAGILGIEPLLAPEGPETPDARFQVLSTERDIHGDRKSIEGPTSRSSFVLPADSYIVKTRSGQASAEKEVEVRPGELTEATAILEAGILRAEALEEDGTPVSARIRWTVFSIEDDIRERETVAGPTSRNEFLLHEGDYLLRAEARDRDAEEKIEIKAGGRLNAEITLPDSEKPEPDES